MACCPLRTGSGTFELQTAQITKAIAAGVIASLKVDPIDAMRGLRGEKEQHIYTQ
jgi:hypothetical protein